MTDRRIIIVAKCYDSSISGPANIVRGLIAEYQKEKIPLKAILLKEGVSKLSFIRKLNNILRNETDALVNVHTEGFLIPLIVYCLSKIYKQHSYYLTVHGIYQLKLKMAGYCDNKYVQIEKF